MLYTDGVPTWWSTSSAVEVFPCGSRSMTRTRDPCWARLAARLTALVVLPTPPFWLAIVMIRQLAGRGHGWSLPPPRTPAAASAARPIGVSCGLGGTSGITTEPTSPLPWAAVPPCIASSTTFLLAYAAAYLAGSLAGSGAAGTAAETVAVSRETATDSACLTRGEPAPVGKYAPFATPPPGGALGAAGADCRSVTAGTRVTPVSVRVSPGHPRPPASGSAPLAALSAWASSGPSGSAC